MKTEIEAKFTVPDEATFARLLAATRIGEYSVVGTHTMLLEDRFLDTAARDMMGAGYCLRLRQVAGGDLLATLKGLRSGGHGDSDGHDAIHRRQEYQSVVAAENPLLWPHSDIGEMVRRLAGEQPLEQFAALRQTRIVSYLQREGATVAEMSLDRVTMDAPAGSTVWLEIEAELVDGGDEQDIAAIVATLSGEYGLLPQPLSKFERALSLLAGEEA